MYLKLPIEDAIERNNFESFKRGCSTSTCEWWSVIELKEGLVLDVGDGDGLTKAELKLCVKELDNDEVIVYEL